MSQTKNNINTKSLQHSTNTNNISDSINTKEQPAPPAASAGLKSNKTQWVRQKPYILNHHP